MILYIFCYGHSRVLLSILRVFYAACMFYGTAFMYNHAILCIFSPILEVEINIIIIITQSSVTLSIGTSVKQYVYICTSVSTTIP